MLVDPAGWGESDRGRPELVDVLQNAVVRRRKVWLTYAGRTREESRRLIDPWGLIDKDDIWYLVAGTDKGQRTFRIDRTLEATVTEIVADRPDDFELSRAWQRVVGDVERKRSLESATVLVHDRFVWVLRGQFGRHCEVGETLDDGRTRVRVAAPTPLSIAQYLAGWGDQVEVIDSEPVRAELARIGAELTARYAPG